MMKTRRRSRFRKHRVSENLLADVTSPPSPFIPAYESVAESIPQPELLFLNYGFWQPDLDDSWIAPSDVRYRHHLNLVRHVLAGIDQRGKSVLEVGCGRGGNCYYLALYSGAARIVGTDICAANLALARRNPRLERVELVVGDAQRLPFAGSCFDIVLNLESSHCYGHFDRFVAEVGRVLKSSGFFCFADLWGVDVMELGWPVRQQALQHSSFDIITQENISEQVFQAMGLPGNISEQFNALSRPENAKLIARINRGVRALRAGLAIGEYSYQVCRMQKRRAAR
jgi:SAM-dependent methyltransferase